MRSLATCILAEKAIQRPPDIASSRTQIGRLGGIPDSDREVIDKILDLDEAVNHYNPITFDKTKYYYRNSETTEELIDYFIIWARQGADDPLCYLSAVAHLQYPWIYPSQTMDYYNIDYEALKKSVASLNADYAHGKALIVRDSLNYQALPSLERPRNTISPLAFAIALSGTKQGEIPRD